MNSIEGGMKPLPVIGLNGQTTVRVGLFFDYVTLTSFPAAVVRRWVHDSVIYEVVTPCRAPSPASDDPRLARAAGSSRPPTDRRSG